mmetsp:Transcript_38105/g.101537  ORF Transcript_38105/g.101537 Transcript_38105/m.101537 type:complete len:223 (-) Transcript_38105:1043-1711(-)
MHVETLNRAANDLVVSETEAVVPKLNDAPNVALKSRDVRILHIGCAELQQVIRVVQVREGYHASVTQEVWAVSRIHPSSWCLHIRQTSWSVRVRRVAENSVSSVYQDCPVTPLRAPRYGDAANVHSKVSGSVTCRYLQQAAHDPPLPGLVDVAEDCRGVTRASTVRTREILPHLLAKVVDAVVQEGVAADAPEASDRERSEAFRRERRGPRDLTTAHRTRPS